jgi:hypothetical protein
MEPCYAIEHGMSICPAFPPKRAAGGGGPPPSMRLLFYMPVQEVAEPVPDTRIFISYYSYEYTRNIAGITGAVKGVFKKILKKPGLYSSSRS